ncbi:hypothetical protein IFR05_017227 [Cadophora sp. M221]|nr:hypothetical protein IFR05_017227 [Cadophora sp. M221]
MAVHWQNNANVRLLACLVDEDDTIDSDYRFLVDNQHVKYVTTAPGTFSDAEDDRTFEPILLDELFPPFPTGDLEQLSRRQGLRDQESRLRQDRESPVCWGEESLISGTGVGPKFLGHLTEGENGRVVGFVAEYVEGASNAGPEDFDGCKKALGLLHGLGIKLGDINKYNFLVRDEHDVVLVDFEVARRDCSPSELEAEMSALKSRLDDKSFLGGVEVIQE